MIAGAERVRGRVHEDQHAFFLIVVEEPPGDRQRGGGGEAGTGEQPDAHPGQEHHDDPAKGDGECRTQIRLQHDQCRRQADQHQRRPQRHRPGFEAARQAVIIARQHQHDRQLHELRRLQLDDAEVEPALAAAAHATQQFDAAQRQQHHAVQRPGDPQPERRRHEGQRQHHAH